MARTLSKGERIDRPVPQPVDDHSTSWRALLVVFALALAYRLLYLAEASRFADFSLFYMDQEYHLEWARAILSGTWTPPYDLIRGAAFFRAPLYPHFLAGVLALTGGSTFAARVVQLVLGSVSCSLACALGTKLLGRRVGMTAGVVCALYWVLAYFDGELLIPVLLVFLSLLGFLLWVLAAERGSGPLAALSGLSFGLFAIARPNILVFLPVAAVWLAHATRQHRRLRRALLVGAFAVLTVVPPAAVTLRNHSVSGDWVVVASQGGVNFYIGNNPSSNGMQAVVPGTQQTWWGGYEDTIAIAEEAEGRRLTASQVSAYWFGRAFDYIRSDTGDWLRLTARKALAHISDVELPNNEPYEARRDRYVTLRSVPLGFAPLFALSLVAAPVLLFFGRLPRRLRGDAPALRQSASRLIIVFLVLYSLTVVAFFVTGRYRIPLVPFVVIGASAALVSMYDALRARDVRRLVAMFVVATAIAGMLRVDWLDVRRSTAGFASLSDAHDMLESGDLDGAIERLTVIADESLVQAPEVYTSLIRAVIARDAPGDRESILRIAESGVDRFPGDAELLWYAAMGRFERRDWDASSRHLSAYLVARPDDARALFFAASAAYSLGDRQGADRHLSRAEALGFSDPLAAGLRAQLDSEAGSGP